MKAKNLPFLGMALDEQSRCYHYHSENDIVALKCQSCQKYYACYHCHDSLEDHLFVATNSQESYPVMCGVCQHLLSLKDYQKGYCIFCQNPFNPKCSLHYDVYFKKE
ncbi:CHY zinc finger protein [Streptococcus uberis]|uniref:CHY zinc finger protein n=1 Tax=Streptococcus uberis TaxID=1349 RepID=UPI00193AA7D4|nr:CHY zinc finger protein [Streptococcus uberis]